MIVIGPKAPGRVCICWSHYWWADYIGQEASECPYCKLKEYGELEKENLDLDAECGVLECQLVDARKEIRDLKLQLAALKEKGKKGE